MYGDGTAPFHGVFSLRIRGAFTYENLQQALAKIQAKHQMLKTVIQEDAGGVPWFVVNDTPTAIPVRVVQRHTEEDWMQETRKEWATLFEVKTAPLLRVVWLQSPEVSDLLLTVHHCAFDGGAVLTLVHDLLALLDEPEKEIGVATALPFTTIHDLVPDAVYFNRKSRLRRGVLKGVARLAGLLLPAMAFFKKQHLGRDREDYLITWQLDKEASSALLRRCTKRRVTTHAALSAAFLMAFQQVKGRKARNKVVCPVDIRRYVKEIKKDTLFAFGMAANLSVKKGTGSSFWEIAKQVQADLSEQTGKLNGYEYLMNFECFHPALRRSKKKTKEHIDYDLIFSNLGRLDIPKAYASFEVEAIYPPTVMGPTGNYNTVLTTTFRGQMDFSFTGSTHHFLYEEAIAVKTIAMQLLLEEEEPADVQKTEKNVFLIEKTPDCHI